MKHRTFALALAVFVAMAALSVFPVFQVRAATTTLYPVADATCNEAQPAINFGYAVNIQEGYNNITEGRLKCFIKFNLQSYNLSAITSAKLRLLQYNYTEAFQTDISHIPDDSWTELGITWENAPYLGDIIVPAVTFVAEFPYSWWQFDVTDAVKSDYDQIFSIALTNTTDIENGVVTFFSREYYGRSPELVITYDTPPPPPPSEGEWTLTGISGNWSYSTDPLLLSAEGWNVEPAFANFTHGNLNKTFADGEGFQVNFTVSIKGDRREWWWWEGTKRFYFSFGLHGTGGAGYSLFYIAHEQGIVMRTSEAKVGTQLQYNVGKPFPTTIGETVDTDNALWHIQFIRVNATTLKVVYATNIFSGNEEALSVTEGSIKTFSEIITVDPSIWENPELVLYAGHDGSGTFSCTFGDIYVGAITGLEDQAPPGLNPNPFQWLIDGFNFIWSLTTMVGAFVGAFLPILPFIFLFYALDVIVTSVQVGSVQPIGKFAMTIWEFLLKIWDVLVRIGNLIWDAITFWT